MRKTVIILLLFIGIAPGIFGQKVNIYDLLTEPSLNRPLTPHKGILQLYAGYGLSNGNKYFDENGVKLPFNESLLSMLEHDYIFDVSYGVTEHIEFHTDFSYRNRYESVPTFMLFHIWSYGEENRIYHTSGLTSLNMDIKYRLPALLDGFDMYVYGGLSLPVTNQHPKEPTHTITLDTPDDPASSYHVNYEFNPAAGSPATYYSTGFKFLYAIQKYGISANLNIQRPFSDVETYLWNERLYGDEFTYEKLFFNIRPKGVVYGSIQAEAQLFSWFNFHTSYQYMKETPGWSDETGQKVSLTRSSASFVSAGFEIQVSTHLRLFQNVNIPVSGKNTLSEFNIQTGITYSLVPLEKLYYK